MLGPMQLSQLSAKEREIERMDWRQLLPPSALSSPAVSRRTPVPSSCAGLQRPAIKRGQSSANLDAVLLKLTQEPPAALLGNSDSADLTSAIAKLNSSSILHTEKRAIERLLAQRYEDALAAAALAGEGGTEVLGGGSEVLRQVLVVFKQNNLATELDRSGAAQGPAEWRVRTHAARRRALLVVRAMCRLKREVKRLGNPIPDLGWLVPVAAQERWGQLKALAAKYRALEGALQDGERSQAVMRYSAEGHVFLPANDQPPYSPGSGYAMLQLLWPGHATFVNDAGELERLPHSLMQELRSRNTEWFISRSTLDLAMLTEDGALDLRTLAYVASMWTDNRFSLAVEAASTYVKHRELIAKYGSVLLCRKPKVRYTFRFSVLDQVLTGPTALRPKLFPAHDLKAQTATPAPAPGGPHRPTNPLGDEPRGPPGGAASAAPGGGPTPAPSLFHTGLTEHQLAHAASHGIDTIMLRLHLSMTDLTMHHAIKLVALRAHRAPLIVRGPQDGAQLVEVLRRSDEDLRNATQRLAAKLPSFTRHHKPPQNILVLVQDNGVSLTAVNCAAGLIRRERGDRIHMVTMVPTEAQRAEGSALLERFMRTFRMQSEVVAHVLDQAGRGLLECVSDLVTTHRCGMVVVGSASITAAAVPTPRGGGGSGPPSAAIKAGGPGGKGPAQPGPGIIGGPPRAGGAAAGNGALGVSVLQADDAAAESYVSSVALSILRTSSVPVLIVTANTRNYLKASAPGMGRIGASASQPIRQQKHGAEMATPAAASRAPARPAVGGVGASGARLACMVCVERHGRPMMHHLTRFLLEPSLRQDTVTLAQVLPQGLAPGNQGYDPQCIQAVALKTLMANYESIASASDFHSPTKVLVQGEWQNALCTAARDYGAQLLCLQLPPSTSRALSPGLLQLVRACPCPLLVYPERVIVPGSGLLVDFDDEA
ncbi:hypothetical protein TSOC_000270 [Tetrabaena socialis]|uniref:Uncharacterized protein n=1 Tax=Tetrabaena socialis TaxID=47790 RepID=A0A2J8AJT6_9CHLO|nr:hypothetical protein TSOC_000270 [Tetrabaena socialis]|eukprot:PNH12786.1 hypothetical protein TSOC_000270 [Tetrabaena socialis]